MVRWLPVNRLVVFLPDRRVAPGACGLAGLLVGCPHSVAGGVQSHRRALRACRRRVPMPCLTIIAGEQSGKQFDLANRPLSIGRDPSRDIQLLDPRVSRKHALLHRAGEGYAITPVKTLNGVRINDAPIEAETTLRDGDRITLGDTVLRYDVSMEQAHANALHERKLADRQRREFKTIG